MICNKFDVKMIIILDGYDWILIKKQNKYFYSCSWFESMLSNGLEIQINNAYRFKVLTLIKLANIFKRKSNYSSSEVLVRLCCFLMYVGKNITYRDLSDICKKSLAVVHKYVKKIML